LLNSRRLSHVQVIACHSSSRHFLLILMLNSRRLSRFQVIACHSSSRHFLLILMLNSRRLSRFQVIACHSSSRHFILILMATVGIELGPSIGSQEEYANHWTILPNLPGSIIFELGSIRPFIGIYPFNPRQIPIFVIETSCVRRLNILINLHFAEAVGRM
jgi:hypothetical protein